MECFRVLIVDDLPAATRILELFLGRRGYQVHTVNDSRQALAAVREFRPEVVLLDISMPHLSGYEVARRIRKEPGFKSVPIIAVTAFDHADHLKRAEQVGINFQVTKPCDFGRLCDLIESCSKPTHHHA